MEATPSLLHRAHRVGVGVGTGGGDVRSPVFSPQAENGDKAGRGATALTFYAARCSGHHARRLARTSLVISLLVVGLYWLFPSISNGKSLPGFVVHMSRPLWDREGAPWVRFAVSTQVPTLRQEGAAALVPGTDENSCRLLKEGLAKAVGGVELPGPVRRRRVYDAFRFNGEFDQLSLRLFELAAEVERVFVFETEVSSTGKPRTPQWWFDRQAEGAAFFEQLTRRGLPLALAKEKIVSVQFPRSMFADAIETVVSGRDQWAVEDRFKRLMGEALIAHGLRDGDVVLDTDCDEIPRRTVVQALGFCELPDGVFPLNLEMRNYLYSYEFLQMTTWKFPGVVPFRADGNTFTGSRARHPRRHLVLDAGWHCSWCFPTMAEFVHKLKTYVHTELSLPQFYDEERIHRYVCSGEELFDRYPEVFTLRDAFQALTLSGRITRLTEIDAPRFLKDRVFAGTASSAGDSESPRLRANFKYLIPGGCRRGG